MTDYLLLAESSFFFLPPPFNFVVILVLVCVAGGVLTSAGKYIRDFAIHRQELQFKREMVERGLSIEEIADLTRIQHAGPFNDTDDDE